MLEPPVWINILVKKGNLHQNLGRTLKHKRSSKAARGYIRQSPEKLFGWLFPVLVHSLQNELSMKSLSAYHTSLYLNLILGCESNKGNLQPPNKNHTPKGAKQHKHQWFCPYTLGRYPKLPQTPKKERIPKHKLLVKHPEYLPGVCGFINCQLLPKRPTWLEAFPSQTRNPEGRTVWTDKWLVSSITQKN